jgi:hypothetical protein
MGNHPRKAYLGAVSICRGEVIESGRYMLVKKSPEERLPQWAEITPKGVGPWSLRTS